MARKELDALIDQLVINSTFKLEGVEIVNALRAKTSDLEQALESKIREVKNLEERGQEGVRREAELRTANNALFAENVELRKKLESLEKTVLAAQLDGARGAAFREAFLAIFKPTVVREEILRNSMQAIPTTGGGGHYTVPVSETVQRTEGKE